jgi:hypothetical protein
LSTGEGYGAIIFQNRVVGAMYQLDKADPQAVAELVQEQKTGMPLLASVEKAEKTAHYWFWSDGGQTAMVCSNQAGPNLNLTIAMGDNEVLKAIDVPVSPGRAAGLEK